MIEDLETLVDDACGAVVLAACGGKGTKPALTARPPPRGLRSTIRRSASRPWTPPTLAAQVGARLRARIPESHGCSGLRRRRLLPQVLDPGRRRRTTQSSGALMVPPAAPRLPGPTAHRRSMHTAPRTPTNREYRQHHRPEQHRGPADRADVRGARLHRRRAELRRLRHFDLGYHPYFNAAQQSGEMIDISPPRAPRCRTRFTPPPGTAASCSSPATRKAAMWPWRPCAPCRPRARR